MPRRKVITTSLASDELSSTGLATVGLVGQLENLDSAITTLESTVDRLAGTIEPILTQTETEAGSLGSVRESGISQTVEMTLDLSERVRNLNDKLNRLNDRVQL